MQWGKRTMRCVVEDGCVLDVTPGLVAQEGRQFYLLVKIYYEHATVRDLEKRLLKYMVSMCKLLYT